jgi:ribosomal protein S18 acetylase RimI-like enzyme
MTTTPSDSTPGQSGLRRATADDLPAIRAVIDAAYARYLTRMDKPPAPMFRDYGPSVEAGTTWVAGSPLTAVLTLYPRDDHLYVENIAVDPSAQGCGLGRALMGIRRAGSRPPQARPDGPGYARGHDRNQAIYARLGYVEIERRSEDGYRRIYMEKPLTD